MRSYWLRFFPFSHQVYYLVIVHRIHTELYIVVLYVCKFLYVCIAYGTFKGRPYSAHAAFWPFLPPPPPWRKMRLLLINRAIYGVRRSVHTHSMGDPLHASELLCVSKLNRAYLLSVSEARKIRYCDWKQHVLFTLNHAFQTNFAL